MHSKSLHELHKYYHQINVIIVNALSPIFEMSNVLEKIEHLAEYVTFSHFCDQFLNLSSIDSSRNVTLYFLLDISIFQGRNYKKNIKIC